MLVSELARRSHDVSRVNVRRVYFGDEPRTEPDEPSTVTFWPKELHPFALRYSFWRVVDEELPDNNPRKCCWQLARPPEAIPPNPTDLSEWTHQNARTLTANSYAYRRYAEDLLDGRPLRGIRAREEMLALAAEADRRMRDEDVPDVVLLGLKHRISALQEAGYDLGEIAEEVGMSPKKFFLRRREIKRRGL
jgi:hypothetical protein